VRCPTDAMTMEKFQITEQLLPLAIAAKERP